MAQFGVEIRGLPAVMDFLKKLPNGVREVERRITLKLAKTAEAGLKTRIKTDFNRRTGSLIRSAGSSNVAEQDAQGVFTARAGYGAESGPSAQYARVQEGVDRQGNYIDATEIHAKKRLLAIPIGDALTSAGVPRYKGPRDFGDVNPLGGPGFWMKFNANVFFVVPKGRKGELIFLYLGLPSVRVKGKQPLLRAGEEARGQAAAIIEAETRRALAAA